MTDEGAAREGPVTHGPYFFLSYAHSLPLEGYAQVDPDPWVRRFFDDLTAVVRRHASRRSGLIAGFFDQEIPPDANWDESLSRAIGSAEVFVPLYSPGYLARAWPGREWACFRWRVERAKVADPDRRFAPVLWTPLPGKQNPPGMREALALGATEPDYAENGLRALLQLKPYHHSYLAVVGHLAERIVSVAENAPLAPSRVPGIDKMTSPFLHDARLAVFTVAVAAPTTATVPAGGDSRCYGASSVDWSPFQGQELSLAACVKQIAERLDFEVEFTGIGHAGDPAARGPGIILIDPWFLADEKGRDALRSAVRQLPRWVLPVLALGSPDDHFPKRLAQDAADILSEAGALPTESARRAARGVDSLEGFVSIVPVLVAEAERQYLRHGPGPAPAAPSRPRPRLSGAGPSATRSSAPHHRGEARDA